MKTIAFFGHRQIYNKVEIQDRLMELLSVLLPKGFSRLLIGTHGDFDNVTLSTCLQYKKRFNQNITIDVVVTSLSFLNKDEYGYSKIDNYKNMGCGTVFYDIEEVYFKKRITYSNEKMVNESNLIICYDDMDSYKSGAKTAIKYAQRQNKTIINLFKEKDKITRI